jgi:pyruvate dehydrogenase kinase 2/3/4
MIRFLKLSTDIVTADPSSSPPPPRLTMSAGFKISGALWDKIHHFASFPQTGVSLQQMVLFGQHPSQGTLLKASQFLHEELPVRLAHRVKELDELPHNLGQMPSIIKVKNWYAQSFEVTLIVF